MKRLRKTIGLAALLLLLGVSAQAQTITVHPWWQSTAIVPGGYAELRGYPFLARAPQPDWRDGGYRLTVNGVQAWIVQLGWNVLDFKFPDGTGPIQTIRIRGGSLDRTITLDAPSPIALPALTGGGHFGWFQGPALGIYIQNQTIVQPTTATVIELRLYTKDLGGIKDWILRISGNGQEFAEPFTFEAVDQTDPERVTGRLGRLSPGVYLLQLMARDTPGIASPPMAFNFQ